MEGDECYGECPDAENRHAAPNLGRRFAASQVHSNSAYARLSVHRRGQDTERRVCEWASSKRLSNRSRRSGKDRREPHRLSAGRYIPPSNALSFNAANPTGNPTYSPAGSGGKLSIHQFLQAAD